MKLTGFVNAIETLHHELIRASRMHDKLAGERLLKNSAQYEALHFWDGKMTGLKIALEALKKVRHED